MPGREELRIDLHVKVLDRGVVQRAKARGIDVLVYAPHFVRLPAIRERAARFSDGDLAVIPAREVFAGSFRNRTHVLAIGLDEPVPDFITLRAAMDAFDRQGAAVLVPHPAFMTVSLGDPEIRAYRDRIHAVETYNPKHLPRHNRRARSIADDRGLPAFASSYAHLPRTVGEVWTAMPNVEPTEDALVDALKRGAPRTIGRRNGAGHRLSCTAEFAHLFWENSAKKAFLLARGPKPTNPHHPAYDGRYDDAAVYGAAWFDRRRH